MIYITGDTHIPYDVDKLFTGLYNTTREDYVVVLGDFGLYWKDDDIYKRWRDALVSRPFTILWLDGNHENHQWISQFSVTEWHGGKVQQTEENIIHLMRGQVYNIEGHKFFVCGGASSYDKAYRTEGVSWWREEDISNAECEEAINNLDKNNWEVDYVLTHNCPQHIIEPMFHVKPIVDPTAKFLDELCNRGLKYKDWYFGHWHRDRNYGKFHCLYNSILRLKI